MKVTTLSLFNGGIVNEVAGTKTEPTTATACLDADISFGDLRPLKTDSITGKVPVDWKYQDGHRSVVRFGEHYYWSDNRTGELDSTLGYMGVFQPSNLIGVQGLGRGDKFVGRYRYTYTFETNEGFESVGATIGYAGIGDAMTEINTVHETAITTYDQLVQTAQPFNPKNKITVSNRFRFGEFGEIARGNNVRVGSEWSDPTSTSRNIIGYNEGAIILDEGKLYRAKQTIFAMRIGYKNRPTPYDVSYGRPIYSRNDPRYRSTSGRVVDLVEEMGDFQYPGNAEYWELVDNEIIDTDFSGFSEIRIYDIDVPEESYLSKVNIYRTVADGDVMFLAATLPAGTSSFVDSVSDEQLVSGRVLGNTPVRPPVFEFLPDGSERLVPSRYLTEQLGQFYLAAGDRIYLSEQDNPHAWDVRKFLELEDECTGMASYRDGVLAFTRNRTYQITGSTLADIRLRFIPELQGCKDWRSVAYLNNNPTWISNDGMCQYGFVPEIQTELLQTLTKGKFTWPDIVWATVANRKYYGVTSDKTVLTYDFERSGAISERSMDALYAMYDADEDRVVYKTPLGKVFAEGTGNADREWTYSTPNFTFQSNELKRMRSIWLRCTDEVSVEVEVDGVLKFSGVSKGLKYRRLFMKAGMVGTQFRFTFRSKGIMDQISFEYDEVRR